MAKNGFGKFLKGVALGAAVGVLFAPKKGEETRKDIKDKATDLMDKAKHIDIDDVEKAVNKKIAEIKKELADLDKEKVMALAKEQARHIQSKCDDLVKYAVEKGTPVVEKTCEDVRQKAVDVLKETLNKLEKNENSKKNKKSN